MKNGNKPVTVMGDQKTTGSPIKLGGFNDKALDGNQVLGTYDTETARAWPRCSEILS